MIHKHKPCSRNILYKDNFEKNTLCQVLRDIYFSTPDTSDFKHIRTNIRVAIAMAKAMSRKLREYNHDWENGFWDKK